AELNLLTKNIKIVGVDEVSLSDSQNVRIVPDERTIILKKNRNFSFSGNVYAGRFEFYGEKFEFNYSDFDIKMENLDSIAFYVPHDSLRNKLTQKKKLIRV